MRPIPSPTQSPRDSPAGRGARLGQQVAVAGLALFSVFAPHSIAAAEISLAIAAAGWLVRTLATRQTGFRHTRFDLPIALFFVWTIVSSFLSEEPRISIAKIQSTCVVFLFYLAQAIVTRRNAVMLVGLMILSGVAGTVYSLYDLVRGRGVVVESISRDSALRSLRIEPGDAIWRINGRRTYSVADMDDAIRDAPINVNLKVSIVSQGEHLERPGLVVSEAVKRRTSPSGIVGSKPTHRFRASGWTRHYSTYSEIIQILAQLAFGFALANLRNHRLNRRALLALAATILLALGVALTAMRTVLIALAIGVAVISLRALERRAKVLALAGLLLLLSFGAFVVYQTRAQHALWLRDDSSSLRVQVAKIGTGRILLHPLFGHGMDSMHVHWNEWGFPGDDLLHLHSTPLQLAFDRGLPALALWLWIVGLFWLTASRAEKLHRDSGDTNRYGLLLGATGAVAGFFASSLVNYNFGDGEVALVFWWLLGVVVVLAATEKETTVSPGADRD